MAVAIPLIVMAAGAGAAAAIGVSVTTLAIGTGLVLQATGINAKINKAASKVFGEKLVNIANIAGSVFIGASAAGLLGAAEGASSLASTAASAVPEGVAAAADAADLAMAQGLPGASTASSLSGGASAANQLAAGTGVPPVGGGLPAPSIGEPTGILKQAQQGATKIGEGLKSAWNSMGDKGQAAALQIGGQMLSGASAGKAAEEAEKQRIANENRYKSGSGLTYWQNKPSYTPPGA